jgi:hypothetical protein
VSRKQPEPESGTYRPCLDPTVMSNNPPAKPEAVKDLGEAWPIRASAHLRNPTESFHALA